MSIIFVYIHNTDYVNSFGGHMSRQSFTEKQLQDLKDNPNVLEATSKRIVYTVDFKKKFIEEYRNGKGPREIFLDGGFDVDALGYKRIERASDRWRTAYNEGRLGEHEDYIKVHKRKARNKESLRDTIHRQAGEIQSLETELLELKAELSALRG